MLFQTCNALLKGLLYIQEAIKIDHIRQKKAQKNLKTLYINVPEILENPC